MLAQENDLLLVGGNCDPIMDRVAFVVVVERSDRVALAVDDHEIVVGKCRTTVGGRILGVVFA